MHYLWHVSVQHMAFYHEDSTKVQNKLTHQKYNNISKNAIVHTYNTNTMANPKTLRTQIHSCHWMVSVCISLSHRNYKSVKSMQGSQRFTIFVLCYIFWFVVVTSDLLFWFCICFSVLWYKIVFPDHVLVFTMTQYISG